MRSIGYRKTATLYTAGGGWTLNEQYQWKKDRLWPTDPYGSSVTLLLPMTGSNNSTTFTDFSSSSKTVTVNGNTKISTTQSKWGNGSGYFDGNGDRLTLAASSGFSLGTTFTIEVWLYPTALPGTGNSCRVILLGDNDVNTAFYLGFTPTGNLLAFVPIGAIPGLMSSSSVIKLNEWHHYAVSVSAGVGIITKDGQIVAGPNSITTQTSGSVAAYIGYDTVGTVNFNYAGYMQDLRITKGIARYIADFTPPTALVPQ